MVTLPLYQVDAFTRQVFTGNPAAVCPLETWPDDATMMHIAAENNLSETAFLAPIGAPGDEAPGMGGDFRLRWFTPTTEVRLCGHATLATAFVIFTELGWTQDVVRFETKSGPLWVRRDGDRLAMDFPARQVAPSADPPPLLAAALGCAPVAVWEASPSRSLIAVYEDEDTVRGIRPDFARLTELHRSVAITAPGKTSDCASRFFAPDHGIPEDPVTGSIHCALTPYWAKRLGRPQIHARQVSARGGELFCEDRGERIAIAGYAVKYMQGVIAL
jgi:PhzF family phenazine biosynthesis protein